jgi:hypothetical protein
LRRVQVQGSTDPGRGSDRAKHRRRMESRLVDALGRDVTQAAHDFAADGDADPDVAARQAMLLGGREKGGHDDGAGMGRSAFIRVIEIVAMRRGAVAQRRHPWATAACMTDRRALARLVGRRERGTHVVARARREAEPDDVDQQGIADLLGGRRGTSRQRGDDGGDPFRDGRRRDRRRVRAGHARFIPTLPDTPPRTNSRQSE